MTLFETLGEICRPTTKQNLNQDEAQKVADCFFKSSYEMALASLRNGLNLAKQQNNIKLIKLIEADINLYVNMIAQRELDQLRNGGK